MQMKLSIVLCTLLCPYICQTVMYCRYPAGQTHQKNHTSHHFAISKHHSLSRKSPRPALHTNHLNSSPRELPVPIPFIIPTLLPPDISPKYHVALTSPTPNPHSYQYDTSFKADISFKASAQERQPHTPRNKSQTQHCTL
jgi:hypothetical protein